MIRDASPLTNYKNFPECTTLLTLITPRFFADRNTNVPENKEPICDVDDKEQTRERTQDSTGEAKFPKFDKLKVVQLF